MIFKPAAAVLLILGLAGCSVYREATSPTAAVSTNWRSAATEADRQRLRTWHKAWDEALPRARAANPAAIAADATLFDPDRGLPVAAPPPGKYRCRTYKLGAQPGADREFAAHDWYECQVSGEGEVLRFNKNSGQQRPDGLLFRDTQARMVFLGTLILADETSPLRYGMDGTRDMAGYLDRIGERRWRLVFPYPRFESLLDVTELIPVP